MNQEMLMANLADELQQMGANPEMLDTIISVIQHVLDNPQDYETVLAQAVQDGLIDQGDLPLQFDEQAMIALLETLTQVKQQLTKRGSRGFARGGLAALGRGGDTRLAHINDMEAEVLRRMGGSGSVNPNTGVEEFKGGGLKKIVKAVAPIALTFFAPGIGTALAPAWGAVGQGILGGAISGGLGGLATGGSKGLVRGALLGGASGGLQGYFNAPANGAQQATTAGAGMVSPPVSDFSNAVTAMSQAPAPVADAAIRTISTTAPVNAPLTFGEIGQGLLNNPGKALNYLARSPMVQDLKPIVELGNAGMGAYGQYQGLQHQEEMQRLEQQMMEQALAQGMDQEQAQQYAQQQMHSGMGQSFGPLGAGGNAFGQYSQMFPSYE